MKLVKALLISVFVLGVCRPAGAFDVKSIKGFASLDLFTAGTADNRMDKVYKGAKAVGDIGSYSLDTGMAVGGRIGALYPIEDVADVGLSWGYIGGPTTETKLNGRDYSTTSRRFMRVMAEGKKTVKYNDKISFLGGAGLGVAYGRQEQVIETAYAPVINGATVDTADTYFKGLTWELTAGAVYKATDKMDVEAGVRYTGLPTCDNKNDLNGDGEIPGMTYNALGFFAGVRF